MVKRIIEIDIIKAFLIIFVVIGHINLNLFPYPILINYIYFFHIPAFFIIAGMLYENKHDSIINMTKKTVTIYLLPYFVYLILIWLYSRIFFTPIGWKNMILAGRSLTGFVGVFWYINVLFITIIVFNLIQILVKRKFAKIGLIILLYLISIYVSSLQLPFMIWNIDVVGLALVYYCIGYYLKKLITNPRTLCIALITLILMSSYFLYSSAIYSFNMKSAVIYKNIVIQLLLPLSVIIVLYNFSKILKKLNLLKNTLSFIGIRSLTIMYLHLPIYYTLIKLGVNNWLILVTLEVVLPIICSYFIFEKNKITRLFFLGKRDRV